jgi:leucyl-tRNA synthetase
VQVNGKVRDRMRVSIHATEAELKAAALASPRIKASIAGKTVRNVIVIPQKLVNVVV